MKNILAIVIILFILCNIGTGFKLLIGAVSFLMAVPFAAFLIILLIIGVAYFVWWFWFS